MPTTLTPMYVRSTTGNDANTGLTNWANAKATIANALAAATPGTHKIVFSQVHAESSVATNTIRLSSPGNPVPIICVNDGAAPPTAEASTGVVGSQVGLTTDGDLFWRGAVFQSSTGGTSTAMNISSIASGKAQYENCAFQLVGGGSSQLSAGCLASGAVRTKTLFKNCTVKFTGTGQIWTLGRNSTEWIGGGIDAASSAIPTTVIRQDSTYGQLSGGRHTFIGFNFSAVGAGKTLFDGSFATNTYHLIDCKLNAALGTLIGTSQDAAGCRLIMTNTGSVNNNYSYKVVDYAGVIDHDTTQFLSSGSTAATDGTTQYSHKVQPNSNAKFYQPFCTEWMAIWNDVAGVAQTVAFEILVDAAAGLNDDEVWLEGTYMGNAGDQLASTIDDRCAILTAHAAQAAGVGAASWTKGAPVTGWISQKVSATFTAQKKGILYLRVCAATTTPFYLNPHPSIA